LLENATLSKEMLNLSSKLKIMETRYDIVSLKSRIEELENEVA
jgi:polyhydroxyalkanoate synthesis regulator phasin